MLRLIECPDTPIKWKFFATSAQHYKWLKEDSPEIYEKVSKAIADGRWEANGAMWVEPDTTLASGESLLRQLAIGIRFFEREFGVKQTVAILPDSFGFNGNFPQILRSCGISNFLTSKISWSEYTDFPYSSFVWRGIDGSEVLTHFITSPSPKGGYKSTYAGTATPKEIMGTWKAYKERDLFHRAALHVCGHGDGGGGLTETMVWNLTERADLPKLECFPRVVFPTLTELFGELGANHDQLPVWDDEQYLEAHRGTLTTQEEVKRQNRQLECHLHNVEWLQVLVMSLCGVSLSRITQEIEGIWEEALLFQFHDALPGSSMNEVNVDIIKRGQPLLQRLLALESEVSGILLEWISVGDTPLIVNTLGHRRLVNGQAIPAGGWARKTEQTRIDRDEQETEIYERIIQGETHEVHRIRTSYIACSVPPILSDRIQILAERRSVVTPFFVVSFDSNGCISSVCDSRTGREYLSGAGNEFELYEDRPLAWPAWDIQLYHKEMKIAPPRCQSIEFFQDRIVVRYIIDPVGRDDTQLSTICQTITFTPDAPIIDFRTVVNWRQHNKLLKVAFATTIRNRFARYGIQFGHIQRPTHTNNERDLAKFECAGRWVDLSDSDGGVSMCSDVKCGFDVHERVIRLSLLKAPLQTDKWADFGIRKFTYRLVFHSGGFADARIVNLSDELNVPVLVQAAVNPSMNGKLPDSADFVLVEPPQVILETLKPSFQGRGFVARFYESNGGWCKTAVHFPLLKRSEWTVTLVNALEQPVQGEIDHAEASELSFHLEFTAFELVTLLILPVSQSHIPS
jgi:alpha-mannosidase